MYEYYVYSKMNMFGWQKCNNAPIHSRAEAVAVAKRLANNLNCETKVIKVKVRR
jgi:hypothetical protein